MHFSVKNGKKEKGKKKKAFCPLGFPPSISSAYMGFDTSELYSSVRGHVG